MKTWTADASEHFEAWLGRVRLSIGGDPRVDPDDIAQDLRAHVHAELGEATEPVTVNELERVLESLGNPAQWSDAPREAAPGQKRDWFHRNVTDVFATGQKRLASGLALPLILVALTALALPLLENPLTGAFLLGVAFVIARAHVIHAPHQVAGRRRWAFYLPLAIGIGTFAGLVLAFPVILRGRGDAISAIWMLGAWWVFVGFVAGREPRRVQAVLRPFADGFEPSHARILMLVGAAFFIAATVVMLAA